MAWQKSCRMPGRSSGCYWCYWCYCHVSAAPVPVIVPVPSLPPVQTTLSLPHHSRCSHLLPPLPDHFNSHLPLQPASCGHQSCPHGHPSTRTASREPQTNGHLAGDVAVAVTVTVAWQIIHSHSLSILSMYSERISQLDALQELNYCPCLDVSHGAALIGLT